MGRLLHHIAQVAGQFNLAAAGHHIGLHLQQLTPHLGPGQAVDHAHQGLHGTPLRLIAAHTQHTLQAVTCNAYRLYIICHNTHCRLPAYSGQLPLQHADAGLPGVPGDNLPDGVVRDAQLAALQAVALELLGQQVPLGNLQLFLIGIAGQLNDLHPVQQGPGNGVCGVGGGDEEHVGQVKGQLQKVVPEGAVLFPVQHLQQRRGGITVDIGGQLVYLVQQQ